MRLAPVFVALLLAIAHPALALQPPGQAVRVERSESGLPVVVAQLGSETLRFVLDTGTSRSMIAAGVAVRLGLVPRARFAVVTAAGGERKAFCAGPLTVRIGEVALPVDCLGWVPGEHRLAGAEDLDGLLGADALANVDLWIDLERSRARLAPAGSLSRWVEGDRLAIERIERRAAVPVEIAALGANTPARLVIDSGADRTLLFGDLARRAARAGGPAGAVGRLRTAAGRAAVGLLPLGEVRIGRARVEAGWAGLLPEVVDRHEDGLLPLAALGPVLLDLNNEKLVVGARLRSRPTDAPPL